MVCLGGEPGIAGWKAQTNLLSYGGTFTQYLLQQKLFNFISQKALVQHVQQLWL